VTPEPSSWPSDEYAHRHSHFIAEVLDDDQLLSHFAGGEHLPSGFGIGLDERVVELPWMLAQGLKGLALDAGAALNHEYLLQRVLRHVDRLHTVTLAPEPLSFAELGVSYLFADLRELPYRDRIFDVIVSVSTLEHVGMDNTVYGVTEPRADDPVVETARAVHELRRVLRDDGVLLITLPYGAPEDHGWFRQFGRTDVERFIADAGPRNVQSTVYRYSANGWQVSGLDEASDATYSRALTDASQAPDLAAAARAVVCMAFRF
jgi:SAM-dependent methyltransferase